MRGYCFILQFLNFTIRIHSQKAVVSYFSELIKTGEAKHSRLNVYLLGSSRSGKTSLLQSIRHGKPSLVHSNERFRMVEQELLMTVALSEGRPLAVFSVDFDSQDEFDEIYKVCADVFDISVKRIVFVFARACMCVCVCVYVLFCFCFCFLGGFFWFFLLA